jgi:adenylate cyclase
MRQWLKKWGALSPLKITLFIVILALILFFVDVAFLRFMELKALDLRMVSRGNVASGGETVIVAIDEKSLSELGRWPWPRTVMARLVDRLKAYGVKAIGFDVIFSEPDDNANLKTIAELSREIERIGIQDAKLKGLLEKKRGAADTDAELARSVERAKNVTLGYFFHTSEKEVGHLTSEQIKAGAADIANARYQMVRAPKKVDERVFVHAYSAATNIKQLTDAAENSGYFNAFPDSDGVIRWAPLVIKFQDDYYSSLPISILLQYLEWPMLSLKIADFGVESVRLDDLVIPTDETGRLLINFMGPAGTFPHYSVSDILYERLPPDLFKNKIVLVGATATGIYDMRVTPFSAVYPGVEIHATVIDNILHQNFLIHSGWTKFIDICMIIRCAPGQGRPGGAAHSNPAGRLRRDEHLFVCPLQHLAEPDLSGSDHDDRLSGDHRLSLHHRRTRKEKDPGRLPVLSDGLRHQRNAERSDKTETRRRQKGAVGPLLGYPGVYLDFGKADAGGAGPSAQ